MQKGVGYLQSMLTDESPVWLYTNGFAFESTFYFSTWSEWRSQTFTNIPVPTPNRKVLQKWNFARKLTMMRQGSSENELTNEHWNKKTAFGCKPPISRNNESHRLQKDPKVVWMFNGRGCEFEVFLLGPSYSDAFSKKPLLHQIGSLYLGMETVMEICCSFWQVETWVKCSIGVFFVCVLWFTMRNAPWNGKMVYHVMHVPANYTICILF